MSLLYLEPSDHCEHRRLHRTLFQPLKKLESCCVCNSQQGKWQGCLKLCSRCGERTYCSVECQKTDWNEHRRKCDLRSFYAFLAYLSLRAHSEHFLPHFATLYPVVNNPALDMSVVVLRDGWAGKLVEVDDSQFPGSWLFNGPPVATGSMRRWFLQAHNDVQATKLMKRIKWGDNVLVTLTAIAYTLLMDMYTTTSDDAKKYRRIRLQYRTSPIADFGIAKGSAKVGPEDCLAFKKRSDGTLIRGQDPKDHYWLWFRTIRGEEVTLDLSMYTFNLGIMVDLRGHIPPEGAAMYEFAPAFFEEREIRKETRKTPLTTKLHQELSERVSVLDSAEFAETIPHPHEHSKVNPEDVERFRKFMSRISGRYVSDREAGDTHKLAHNFLHGLLEENLLGRLWARAPAELTIGIDNA